MRVVLLEHPISIRSSVSKAFLGSKPTGGDGGWEGGWVRGSLSWEAKLLAPPHLMISRLAVAAAVPAVPSLGRAGIAWRGTVRQERKTCGATIGD